LERKLIWEQDEQILDIAFPSGAMLVLSPSQVTLYTRAGGQWELRQSLRLTPGHPWPRDLRGRLRVNGAAFEAYLPGIACKGAVEPGLTMECRTSDEPWVLESGSHAMLLGNFVAPRNYFDGRIVTQTGLHRTVAPFYSAASVP